MNTKTNVSKPISYVLLAAIVAAIGANLFSLIVNARFISSISAGLALMGCCSALHYVFKGYKKDAAKYYKFYMLLLYLSFVVGAIGPSLIVEYPDGLIRFITISFFVVSDCTQAAFCMTLALSHDLGKKTSMIMCWVMVVLCSIFMVISIGFTPSEFMGGGIAGVVYALRSASNLVIVLIGLLMTAAKYQDKTVRGTR